MSYRIVSLPIAGVVALVMTAAAATAQTNSGPTAPMSNQGSGESEAAKHHNIVPEKSVTGGGHQSSSGEAAQIQQSAAPIHLSASQQQTIKSYFSNNRTKPLDNAALSLSIGAAVPRQIQLHKLPQKIVSALGGFQGDDYVLVGDQLVIVDNNARRVVAIVPGAV